MWKWRGSKRRLIGSSVFRRDKHSNREAPLRPAHVHVLLHHCDLFPAPPSPTHRSLPSDQLLEGHWRPFNSFIIFFCFVFFSSLKSPQLIGASLSACQQRNKKHQIFGCFFLEKKSHSPPLLSESTNLMFFLLLQFCTGRLQFWQNTFQASEEIKMRGTIIIKKKNQKRDQCHWSHGCTI